MKYLFVTAAILLTFESDHGLANNLPTVQRGGDNDEPKKANFTTETRKGITILRAIPSEEGTNIYSSREETEPAPKLEPLVKRPVGKNRLKYPEMIAATTKAAGNKYDRILAAIIQKYGKFVKFSAEQHGVPEAFILGVIVAESAGKVDAKSPKGAMGLMQLMPATAQKFGVKDAYSASQNIDGGTALIADLLVRYDWDPLLVLAAYNAGEGAVAKYKGVPPYKETREYIPRVLAAYGSADRLIENAATN